ncbi:PAAR-like domain-containing protein [Acidimangrovimonas sediminis]|uniref:PAAR-like domain-containing protein n=1 Tax=Acidimangrovimonas sediminis TaxID=2056283 RepID=UPI000C7FFEC7|nr:PAAR-like domain-containing protein [Acidimangrovimonas sediminis]
MSETVGINGLSLVHKHSSGLVRATLPDVCRSPGYPVPWPNIAFARDLAKGTTTVKSHRGAMCGIKGSEFSVSIADEPGTGGGVKSGVNMHRATFLSWSPNVFLEGKPATRLTDRMLMNKGNTISAGGYFTGPVAGASRPTLDLLCEIACTCLAAGQKQTCVDQAVKALPKIPSDGLYSEITFDRAGQMYRHPDGTPMTRYGVPGSRLDITRVSGGQPDEFVEMKFPGDRLRGTQKRRYDQIARLNGKTLQLMTIPQDCNDCEGQRQPQEEPQDAPVDLPHPDTTTTAAGALVVLGLIGIAACALATEGACLVLAPAL